MIFGQPTLTNKINTLIPLHKFPRFSIFVGEIGSGRKTVILDKLTKLGVVETCSIDVDTVRETIQRAYATVTPIVYVFADADTMSLAAKNALLKVTEEPPNNAYFVMTLTDEFNTLDTIRSRATIFKMDSYASDTLLKYYKTIYPSGEYSCIITKYCQTPGDVNQICSYDAREFNKFVSLVMENIDTVSGANAFKIGDKLNLGTDDVKYDLALFWKAFRGACMSEICMTPSAPQTPKYIDGVTITTKYLAGLRTAGINKQMHFDNWLLDIRKAWMSYEER